MSSSLGNGYIRSSDQAISGSKLKVKKKIVNQEESTGFGGRLPDLCQTGNGDQPGSMKNKGRFGRRRSQPARHAISIALKEQVFKRDHYQCCNCEASPLIEKTVKLEIDHIVPVSRGGTNDPHNLQILCHKCNQLKRASLF